MYHLSTKTFIGPLSNKQLDVGRITREVLRERFRLFRESHGIEVVTNESGTHIFYRSHPNAKGPEIRNTTHFDMQFEGRTCFGVDLAIEPKERGQGHGNDLYAVTEEIARRCGCTTMTRTASGTTIRGETRADYLMRKRGYVPMSGNNGLVVIKRL